MLILLAFILGAITGISVGTLIVVVLTYFKRPIETKLQVIEKQIAIKGPRPRGFIVEPESEAEQVRQKIIERNRKAGRDTPISELR